MAFNWEKFRKEQVKEIIGFFQDERDEKIGQLAAEEVLDFFLETAGKDIYSKGVDDCQSLIKERFSDLEVELDLLSLSKDS